RARLRHPPRRRRGVDRRWCQGTPARAGRKLARVILTHDVILREIASGRLALDPFTPDQVGPASIDLHLGDEIRVLEGGPPVIALDEDADYRTVTVVRRLDAPYVLRPGETIHGITRERIRLPPDVGGWLEGRSRFARLGLMIHVTSGFVAPGV